MALNLPPPVILAHQETLHAIELPPLATFLTSLSVPDQLIKLNDILLRYRTPKSYHRIDIREVSSSELPLSSPEPEVEGEAGPSEGREARRKRRKIEKGEPILLDETDTVDAYKARRGADKGASAPMAVADGNTGDVGDEGAVTGEASVNVPEPQSTSPLDTLLTSTEVVASLKSPTPPTTVKPPPTDTAPPATHSIPPSGPKRRVRELRLDLHTLDAAALFALETWRREVLGLEKLKMEHPDSIWYKDDSPTPEPSPEPIVERRKVGRPRKSDRKSGSQSRTPAVDEQMDEVEKAAEPTQVSAEADVEMGEDQPEIVDKTADDVETKRADSQVVERDHVQTIEAFDNLVDGPGHEQEIDEARKAESTIIEKEKEPTPPPSPDIIVVDGFNRDQDDSDFSPEPSPEPVQRRGRPKKSGTTTTKTLTSTSAFQEAPAPTPMRGSLFQPAEPPTPMGSYRSHPVVAPSPMGSSMFQAAEAPTPMGSSSRAALLPAPKGSSLFQPAEAPTPMGPSIFERGNRVVSSSSRQQFLSTDQQVDDSLTSVSPSQQFRLSPTRQAPPLPPPYQLHAPVPGASSAAPLVIPDSPEKRDKAGFVPFEREQMRIPIFTKAPVIPQRGLHWHDPVVEKGKKRKEREVMQEVEERWRPAKSKAKGRSSKVHFADFVDQREREDPVEDQYEELPPDRGRSASEDEDEWADFK